MARAFGSAAAGLALAGGVAAQGNVTVTADALGDLHVTGDAEGNQILVMEELETDELVIRGLGGTLVDGLPEVRPVLTGTRMVIRTEGGDDYAIFASFDVGNCCSFAVEFYGGEGNDHFRVGDEQAGLSFTFADLGPGDDRFWCGEGGYVRELELHCGEGDDLVDGFYSYFGSGGALLDLGPGTDRVDLDQHAASGPLAIKTGDGADTVRLENAYVRIGLAVETGAGDDIVELIDGAYLESGHMSFDTGEGVDRIRMGGDVDALLGTTLHAGGDADVVLLTSARFVHDLGLSLGTGDDALRIEGSTFAAFVPVVLDGAEGTDRFVDLGGNRYEVPPEVLRFEGPKARRELRSVQSVSTVLAGRVVQPDGTPVPAASVTLAEQGLRTSAAEDGTFRFEDIALPYERAELTAAATVRGRRMATRVVFRPVAEATTEVGDVALVPTRAGVLVLGDDLLALDRFEQRLHAFGNDPLHVSVARFLPEDLAFYEVIWNVASAPLPVAERGRLAAFVRSGGGLHLSSSGVFAQEAHRTLVNELLADPPVGVMVAWDQYLPIHYNPSCTGGAGRWPNALLNAPDIGGGRYLSGVQAENAFAVDDADRAVAGVWASLDLVGGRGRLSFVLDKAWLYAFATAQAVENLQAFLRWEPDAFVAGGLR